MQWTTDNEVMEGNEIAGDFPVISGLGVSIKSAFLWGSLIRARYLGAINLGRLNYSSKRRKHL